jgi:hypothetical protein
MFGQSAAGIPRRDTPRAGSLRTVTDLARHLNVFFHRKRGRCRLARGLLLSGWLVGVSRRHHCGLGEHMHQYSKDLVIVAVAGGDLTVRPLVEVKTSYLGQVRQIGSP